MKQRTQSYKEKAFFSDYWNNRIVTMHLQGQTKKQIVKKVGIVKDGLALSQKHVQWIINKHETFMKLYKRADIMSIRLGSKHVPYYKFESEYMFKCIIPMSWAEKTLKVKPDLLDSNYKNFISC